MGLPTSALFRVEEIPNAGRGVVANQRIAAGTVILDGEPPAAHVIFRQYRKEVCAQCFAYDRGRTLPVRDHHTGKVFCSPRCQSKWGDAHGPLGIEAWQKLHGFVQSRSKAITDITSIPSAQAKPRKDAVDQAWSHADALLQKHAQASLKPQKSNSQALPRAWAQAIDPDILGFFLAGIVFDRYHHEKWQSDVLCLAMDEEPYKSHQELEAHCNSFLQLTAILPQELLPSCTSFVCRTLVSAGSHNAFGIRSGSDDGEEYMGYALYPSASYFNHACSPNILKRRLGETWEFMTARDIEAGEECFITYLGGDERELTVRERRDRLKGVWGFECMCELCKR